LQIYIVAKSAFYSPFNFIVFLWSRSHDKVKTF